MKVVITCPNCNFSKEIQREKVPRNVRWATCPQCKQRFELSLVPPVTDFQKEQVGEVREKETGRKASPWENRSDLGTWQGIYQTSRVVLFSPKRFFRTVTFSGGKKEPLAFGVLLGSVGTMLGFFWQFLIMAGSILSSDFGMVNQFAASIIFIVIMIISPLFVFISLFLTSGILHLLLLIVRGGNNGFESTFRVVSFSQAAQILGVVPFLGGLLGGIWLFIVQIIGLKEIHDTSYLRVIIALLIPPALIFILGIAILIPLIIFG